MRLLNAASKYSAPLITFNHVFVLFKDPQSTPTQVLPASAKQFPAGQQPN